jgi:CrcB protein
MFQILIVAAGGAVGSVLRFLMQGWVQRTAGGPFPLGTLAVNLVGCLAIGLLTAAFAAPSGWQLREEYRFGLTAGLLGGFTTFSAFGLETYLLGSGGQPRLAALYIALSVTLGLAAVWTGHRLGQYWFPA